MAEMLPPARARAERLRGIAVLLPTLGSVVAHLAPESHVEPPRGPAARARVELQAEGA